MPLKIGELVLLMSVDSSYLTEVRKGELHTADGVFALENLKRKNFGDKIRTHLGNEFIIVKPNIKDILEKKVKRLPQIIMPKDVALILAYTGISRGSNVVDIGTGSGFLSIFIASHVDPGKVVTYEKERKNFEVAKKNILASRLKNLRIKLKNGLAGISEKNLDLITVDFKGAEKFVKKANKSLKIGGYFVAYSPYVEQVKAVVSEMRKVGFSSIMTVENIVREWRVSDHTLPEPSGIMHTGFITFARKAK